MQSPLPFSCVLVGGQSLLIGCGEQLLSAGHSIRAVITDDGDVARWCATRGLPHLRLASSYPAILADLEFDYLFSIVNYTILPASILRLPRRAAINFHDGPLPHYAGVYTTSWALLNRESHHAITWHLMTEQADKGGILLERRVPVTDTDTALTLNARCYEMALAAFAELIPVLASGEMSSTAQDLSGFRLFTRCQRPAPACLLDWRKPARELATLGRALSFGHHPNPIGIPKVLVGHRAYLAEQVDLVDEGVIAPPGRVVGMDEAGVTLATGDGSIRLAKLTRWSGEQVNASEILRDAGIQVGNALPAQTEENMAFLEKIDREACRHEPFWRRRVAEFEPLDLPFRKGTTPSGDATMLTQSIAEAIRPLAGDGPVGAALLTAAVIYLSRIGRKNEFGISFRSRTLRAAVAGWEEFVADRQPLLFHLDKSDSFSGCHRVVEKEVNSAAEHFTYARDLLLRLPDVRRQLGSVTAALAEVGIERVATLADYEPASGLSLNLVIPDDGQAILWAFDTACYDEEAIRRMQRQLEAFLTALKARPDAPVASLSVVNEEERRSLAQWNATTLPHAAECIQHAFDAQVRRTPDARALLFRDEALSFQDLNARAEKLAGRLRQMGVGPDQIVGLLLPRSVDMVIGMLGILKAGAAYLPLDPAYPAERLRYMIDDSAIRIVVTDRDFSELLAQTPVAQVQVGVPEEFAPIPVTSAATPENLAYMIYTSGSTGKPKGVMVTHRNVANFFAGMDQCLGRREGGVWLAVTSISFDISVLEILWSLTRGLTVVLYSGDDRSTALAGSPGKPLDLSLYYFPSDDGTETREKFRLLLEGAQFADANGFAAVWTPERHFHAFGGLFPNPSVSSAAIAAITRNVKIRAGSCVLPLHHPVRVAEEWAFVDNLSNGRVGIAFATGWQPNDFVFAPDNYAKRHQVMYQSIATVRALWRGETVELPGVGGNPVSIAIKPRPIQRELPFWITAAGNPETYRQAGEMGANLLTHLLGQSLEELAGKLRIYRDARRAAGHPGEGYVTLMLHTLVGPDEEDVRAKAHDALKSYLATAAGLIQHYASSFPTFKTHVSAGRNVDEVFASLSPADVDALLEHAVARYYETSGLFGTPERCEAMVERCAALGVDEVACLIDFGMAPQVAFDHLPWLGELRARLNRAPRDDYSIPALIERHGVTHFQCTPSMASMLVADRRGREALRKLSQMLVGGEALPPSLAAELRTLLEGDLINMYGPTETTVWSSTFRVTRTDSPVTIGRPIANTALYVLDDAREPVPVGVPGELYIGGEGVTRGYWKRPELTAERFLADPFASTSGARMYRTGDRVRLAPDGNVEFLGRIDNQVKIRGYRIELGEIESALRAHPSVREAVVTVWEEAGAKRLAAYLVLHPGSMLDATEIRLFLRQRLAEFMLPSSFTVVTAFPQTPNGKLDRRALPAPNETSTGKAEFAAPVTATEQQVAESWQFLLKKGRIGVNDDFFHIGGDSLGAVQLVAMLSDTFGVELPLEALFVAPTIARLARKIDALKAGSDVTAA